MDVIKECANTVFILGVLLFSGLILLILKRKEKLGIILLTLGISALFLLSFAPFSKCILWMLESKYPPLMDLNYYKKIKYVVVLTAWDSELQSIPYIQNMGYRTALRTIETRRIYGEIPHCRIIISGTKNGGELISELLSSMNVPRKNILIDRAKDTTMSAINIKNILRNENFILVTSAVHMPRSILLFSREGLNPIPAPADYIDGYYKDYTFPYPRRLSYYFPNTGSFMESSAALYEYFGLVKCSIISTGNGK
jgi:uncharacterized SAM-binding protein YcdF (DUF218 family)